MATNFNVYNPRTVRINVEDLEVGQTLVRIVRPKSHFGTISGSFSTTEYIVKKVLKTRVVLESKDAIVHRHGQEPQKHEVRLVVETGKWSVRVGELKNIAEGQGNSYNPAEYNFATHDDPIIEQLRTEYAARAQEQKIKADARVAIDKITGKLHPDLESVLEAMSALGALADVLRAEQR